MPNYTKVYRKNKKESKISFLQKFSMLRSIFIDKMNVKEVILMIT